MYTALLALILVGYLALAWRNLRYALLLLAALLPTYLLRISLGPLPTTALEIMIILAAIVWVAQQRPTQRDIIRALHPLNAHILVIVAIALLSVFAPPDTLSALGYLKAYFIEPILIFVMLRSTFHTKNDWVTLLISLAVSAAVLGCVSLLQAGTGLAIPTPWDIERRVTSVFDYPNAVGLFSAPILAAVMTLAFTLKQRALKIVAGITAPLIFTSITLAQTEAAFIALPAALLCTLLLSHARPVVKASATLCMTLLAIGVLATSTDAREKLLLNDLSGNVRLAQWSETLHFLSDHPVLGAGLGGYPTAIEEYHDNTLYEIFQYPHNILLNIWVELGLLGVLAWLWLAFALGKIAYSYRHEPLVLAGFAGLLTMTIHGLVDVPYFKNDLAIITWIMIAILTSQVPQKHIARA